MYYWKNTYKKEGYDVTAFADVNSAFERIKNLPDLWLMDIMLPDIDGYELMEKIKAYNKIRP